VVYAWHDREYIPAHIAFDTTAALNVFVGFGFLPVIYRRLLGTENSRA
jgi:hypothetical protein